MNRRSNRSSPTKPVEFTNIHPPLNLTKLPKEEGAKLKSNSKSINGKPNNISFNQQIFMIFLSSKKIFPNYSTKKSRKSIKLFTAPTFLNHS